MTGKILVVDDDQDILIAAKLLLKKHFNLVSTCHQPELIPSMMADSQFDAILLDMNFSPGESSGKQGFVWLERILAIDPQAAVVMITAHGDMKLAVEAMKCGASDFVAKPWQNEKLIATLSSACQLGKSRRETQQLKQRNKAIITHEQGDKVPLLGASPAMLPVLSLINKSAPTDANILILGENGTGKELVARSLYRQSDRNQQAFISIDLGAVAESLFESELFGHKKGAFTGADHDRDGKLVAAQGGTVFLDEIANLPLHLQAKLLTVLEQRKVTPLGSNQTVELDIRVIAATNASRKELHDGDKFRQDLLFRLNTVEITIPPLRDRSEDIFEIADHYLTSYCKKYRKEQKYLSSEASTAAKNYPWPGNVRALRHAIERAVILSDHQQISASDLQLAPVVEHHHSENIAVTEQTPGQTNTLNLEEMEKQLISNALQQHGYNISKAAKALGLTRASLYRRMEKYDF